MKRCAIYTRKSTDDGLDQAFNSLDAQREAAQAYILSQKSLGWSVPQDSYDDGGYSGGTIERPAFKRLMQDVEAGKVDVIVVYKVDRFSRSLMDFARVVAVLERHDVAFVSVTQQFNTGSSMGRLMLNVLLSFAQFERETISERVRDKIWAARRRGQFTGGPPPLGYAVVHKKLVVVPQEADRVRTLFHLYLKHGSLDTLTEIVTERGWRTKRWVGRRGRVIGDRPMTKTYLHTVLRNVLYIGMITLKKEVHQGEHDAIVSKALWDKVQTKLGQRSKPGPYEPKNSLLHGVLFCDACGAKMVYTYTERKGKTYRYYACARAKNEVGLRCKTRSIRIEEIEAMVVDHVRKVSQSPEVVRRVHQQMDRARASKLEDLHYREKDLKKILATLHESMLELVGAEGANEVSRHLQLADERDETEGELKTLHAEMKDLKAVCFSEQQTERALAGFDHLWAFMARHTRRQLVQGLFERIGYSRTTEELQLTFYAFGVRAIQSLEEEHA